MPKPADVLAESLIRYGIGHGPRAQQIAERQLAALHDRGYVVATRLELSRLVGHLELRLGDRKHDDLAAQRGRRIVATLRALLDPANDDGEDN